MAIEKVIPKDERRGVAVDKAFPNQEGLGNPFSPGLDRILDVQP